MQGKFKKISKTYIQWLASFQGTKGPVFAPFQHGNISFTQMRTINWDIVRLFSRVEACQRLQISEYQMAFNANKNLRLLTGATLVARILECGCSGPKGDPTKCFSHRNQPLNWVCTPKRNRKVICNIVKRYQRKLHVEIQLKHNNPKIHSSSRFH